MTNRTVLHAQMGFDLLNNLLHWLGLVERKVSSLPRLFMAFYTRHDVQEEKKG